MPPTAPFPPLPLWGTLGVAWRAYRLHKRWLWLVMLLGVLSALLNGWLSIYTRSMQPTWLLSAEAGVLSVISVATWGVLPTLLLQSLSQPRWQKAWLWQGAIRLPQQLLTALVSGIPVLLCALGVGVFVGWLGGGQIDVRHISLAAVPLWKQIVGGIGLSLFAGVSIWWWFRVHLVRYVVADGTWGVWKPLSVAMGLLRGVAWRVIGFYGLAGLLFAAAVGAPLGLAHTWTHMQQPPSSLQASWLRYPALIASVLVCVLLLPWLQLVQAALYQALLRRMVSSGNERAGALRLPPQRFVPTQRSLSLVEQNKDVQKAPEKR